MTQKANGGERPLTWPDDPETVTAADIDFEALAHVLANTCRRGGCCRQYHSVGAHAAIVSEEIEALDGCPRVTAGRWPSMRSLRPRRRRGSGAACPTRSGRRSAPEGSRRGSRPRCARPPGSTPCWTRSTASSCAS